MNLIKAKHRIINIMLVVGVFLNLSSIVAVKLLILNIKNQIQYLLILILLIITTVLMTGLLSSKTLSISRKTKLRHMIYKANHK